LDHKPSDPNKNPFVDDRMAMLDPSTEWTPDAGRALAQLNRRKPASSAPWMRLGMTATILAATVFVLTLLPWQRLWTPEPVAKVATQTQTAPAEKPVEKAERAPEAPAPQQPAKVVSQTPAEPEPQQKEALLDLPDNPEDLMRYLQELAKQREVDPAGIDRTGFTVAAASQANLAEPRVLTQVLPEYTDQAKQAKIQGTVELVVTIKTDGTVQFESFKKTLGYGLDEKAREAIEKWTFAPATKDGVPVSTTVTLSMNFSLR
jgi:TonB family protein